MKVLIEMTDMTCWCGTPFSLPTRLFKSAYNNGHKLYCPQGHTNVWETTEADKQRRRAERAEQEQSCLIDELAAEKRQTAAIKGQLTKHKKRSAAGTCPCCKRIFQNMARHMESQHPDFVAEQKVVTLKAGKK